MNYHKSFVSKAINTFCKKINFTKVPYREFSFSSDNSTRKPRKFWNNLNHQRKFFEEISKTLHVKTVDDWYHVSTEDLLSAGADGILHHYNNSVYAALRNLYPEHCWDPLKFSKLPKEYLNDWENRRRYLEKLGAEIGVTEYHDWYRIGALPQKESSQSLMRFYNNSLALAVVDLFPEFNWKLWRFERIPSEYWSELKNQRAFFDVIAEDLKIEKYEDWYKIDKYTIQEMEGSSILRIYNNQLPKALKSLYPEFQWDDSKFPQIPVGFWKDPYYQKQTLETIGKKLGIQTLDDWYSVKTVDIYQHGGATMLKYFNSSLREALMTFYPEHEWLEWKFNWTTKGFWNEEANVRKALKYLENKFRIKNPDDWYSISGFQLENMGFSVLLKTYGGLIPLLKRFYPELKWQQESANSKSKMQQLLFKIVHEIFPAINDYHFNYHHPFLIYKNSGKSMELDIYIPSLKIAFEYNGEQHYHNESEGKFNNLMKKERDKEKREACKKEGITLIEVPYWWDMKKESVEATIHLVRPDLVPKGIGKPIPTINPGSLRNQ